MVEELLQRIGLDEKEARVYLAVFRSGTASASDIAVEVGESRPSVYRYLDGLVRLGLIDKKRPKKGRSYYESRGVEAVFLLLEKKKAEAARQEEELRRMLPLLTKYGVSRADVEDFSLVDGHSELSRMMTPDGMALIHNYNRELPCYQIRLMEGKNSGKVKYLDVPPSHDRNLYADEDLFILFTASGSGFVVKQEGVGAIVSQGLSIWWQSLK